MYFVVPSLNGTKVRTVSKRLLKYTKPTFPKPSNVPISLQRTNERDDMKCNPNPNPNANADHKSHTLSISLSLSFSLSLSEKQKPTDIHSLFTFVRSFFLSLFPLYGTNEWIRIQIQSEKYDKIVKNIIFQFKVTLLHPPNHYQLKYTH